MKKRFIVQKVCILLFGFFLISGTVFATDYIKSIKSIKSVKNTFNPSQINIAVQENDNNNTDSAPDETNLTWSPSSDGEYYTAKKEVTIFNNNDSNLNSASAFIRVCIVPHWTTTIKDENDIEFEVDVTNISGITEMGDFKKEITGNSYTMGDVMLNLATDWSNNWIYNSDGYFYCRESVSAGNSTPLLLESVSMTTDMYDKIPIDVTLKVDILADSIQTEGQDIGEINALVNRWGSAEILGIQVTKNEKGKLILQEYTPKEVD